MAAAGKERKLKKNLDQEVMMVEVMMIAPKREGVLG
jgi:hypothetical protein